VSALLGSGMALLAFVAFAWGSDPNSVWACLGSWYDLYIGIKEMLRECLGTAYVQLRL
jgi:hypothetical protein